MIERQLSPLEYSEDRRRALREAEKRMLSLGLVGDPQKSLSEYGKESL